MSPSAVEPTKHTLPQSSYRQGGYETIFLTTKPAPEKVDEKSKAVAKYPQYLPTWDDIRYDELQPFDYVDAAIGADPEKTALLSAVKEVRSLTPLLGTELLGIQLSSLNEKQKKEFALLVEERGVVVLRNQDFKDIGIQKQAEIQRQFGKLHWHPTTGRAKEHPAFHIVHRDADEDQLAEYWQQHISSVAWHTDVSYERQSAGITSITALDIPPESGGDTVWSSQVEAYNRLSPSFRAYLETLQAVHSSDALTNRAQAQGTVIRKEKLESVHPVVRVHPVTRKKSLYVNRGFVRGILGLKQEESNNILEFLFDHISKGTDFQVRVKYEEGTVIFWDNRSLCHTALLDFDSTKRRHLFRLISLSEIPEQADGSGNQN